ncbi:esterase family protein [Nisaea acidiphila]|uniref:Esterase family protein n=1 Tax=Nisaea acidiphila TaxID=1862145 RepID=A0A9J7AQD7_9PROT|nr:esterase family protein [Nisaea acidiphila]UUX49439.1 esterase family protein [Nisaea acidiphila]
MISGKTFGHLLAGFWLSLATAGGATAELRESLSFESNALGREMKYSLFLPDDTAGQLPVLYLLHGLGGNERDWQKLGRIEGTMDRLLATGAVPPFAIVMPDAGNSWYVNSEAHGAYEDAILDDLLPYIESHHSLGTTRAIAGLSMGGYGALRLAFRHPARFEMTGALSAAIFPDLTRREDVSEQQVRFFKGAFGTPFDVPMFNRQNFFADIPALTGAASKPAIFVTVGDDDGFGLYEGNVALYLALKRAGIPIEFRMTDGNHTWRLWREEIENVLLYYGQILRAKTE